MRKIRDENFISLCEATKYCNYSQEYLSLRVRQGKIKGIKLGRNWVTKKEWIVEYVETAAENGNGNGKNKKDLFLNEKKNVLYDAQFANEKLIVPPENLPVGQFSDSVQDIFLQKKPKARQYKYSVLFFIISAILISGAYFEREKIGEISYAVSLKTGCIVGKIADRVIGKEGKDFIVFTSTKSGHYFGEVAKKTERDILESSLFLGVKNTLGKIGDVSSKYFNFAKTELSFWKDKVYEKAVFIANIFTKKQRNLATEKLNQEKFLENVKEGMVVVPTDEKEKELLKQKIQESFSDQVQVNISDANSGVVIPVFKERKGNEYLYMLVPTNAKTK